MTSPAVTARSFAYAPVSLREMLERHDEAGPRTLVSLWALALGPIALAALPSIGLDVVRAPVGGVPLFVSFYLPLAACIPLTLWFGWAWGALPAFAASLVLAMGEGLTPGWAAAVACADPLGLAVLVLAYQAAPVTTTLRKGTAWLFFAVAVFVAVLTSSAGAFVWAHALQVGPAETLTIWQGGWMGRLLLGLLIAGPILIMPNVGFNEWGHTFFYAEELFAAPVHWGFALLGLALLALGGIVIHAIGRMKELIDQVAANA